MVHKLTLEHINLTRFSKMRVDLAAQVCMLKIILVYIFYLFRWWVILSKALLLTGGSEAFETSVFIGKVDQFFDALNVTSYTKGIKARKPFQKITLYIVLISIKIILILKYVFMYTHNYSMLYVQYCFINFLVSNQLP